MKILDGTPLSDLTWADVEALIAGQVEEGPTIEFKRELPSKDPKGDRWMQRQDGIGDHARDTIANEIVAFANAYGGTVLIGIEETAEKPPRATVGGTLVPAAAQFVDRFDRALRDRIDPPIAGLELKAISDPNNPTAAVVAIRTPASSLAPHGVGRPPATYVRRGASSEPMSMRDLQNTFWEARTSIERISQVRAERRSVTDRMVELQGIGALGAPAFSGLPPDNPYIAFRCTCIPEHSFKLGGIAGRLSQKTWLAARSLDGEMGAFGRDPIIRWQPAAHAVWAEDGEARHFARWLARDDGTFDLNGVRVRNEPRFGGTFYPGWFAISALQTILMADRLRRLAMASDVPLIVDCEIRKWGDVVVATDDAMSGHGIGRMQEVTAIGPYSFGSRASIQSTFREMEAEIWYAMGATKVKPALVDFDAYYKSSAGDVA